jgi:hypothetical protein
LIKVKLTIFRNIFFCNLFRGAVSIADKTTLNDMDDERAEKGLERKSRGLLEVLFLNVA